MGYGHISKAKGRESKGGKTSNGREKRLPKNRNTMGYAQARCWQQFSEVIIK
jgi:hypothetical protein